jgi:hypothetical protein
VTAVAGDVAFTMAGSAVTVTPDTTVLLPARIVTGRDGSVGLTQAGTKVSVANDTDVEIPAEAVDGNLIARLVQHRGNVFYDVAPRDLGKLRVETPFLVAVIKGTQFNVAVDEDGTTISLFEGSLEIRTPDDSDVIQLNAGEIAIRSLIDDSIRIVGMDDERVAIPPPAAAAADDSATPSTPANDNVAVADADIDVRGATQGAVVGDAAAARANSDEAVAVEAVKPRGVRLDAEIRAGVDLAAGRPSVVNTVIDAGARSDIGIDLEGGIVAVGRLTEVDALDVRGDVGDVRLDAGVELDIDAGDRLDPGVELDIDTGDRLDPGVELDIDPGDAGADLRIDSGLDLDGVLDAEPSLDLNIIVDTGADLTLDTGSLDITLDAAGGGLDLDVDVGAGKADVHVDLDLDAGLRAPALLPRLPVTLP